MDTIVAQDTEFERLVNNALDTEIAFHDARRELEAALERFRSAHREHRVAVQRMNDARARLEAAA